MFERRKGREEVMTVNSAETNAKIELKKILIEQGTLEQKILMLDNIAKEFFYQKYNIDKKTNYAELAEFFGNKKKPLQKAFCEKMIGVLYAGGELNSNVLNNLVSHFQQIIVIHEERMMALSKSRKGIFQRLKLRVFNKARKKSIEMKVNKTEENKQKHKQLYKKKRVRLKRKHISKHKEAQKSIGSIDILDRIEKRIKNIRKEFA